MLDLAERQRLETLFDQIPSLSDRPRTFEELPGGLTNLNIKINTGQEVLVARCSRSDIDLLGIDRNAEQLNTRAAEQAGIGARFVEYCPELEVLVIGYIDGPGLVNEDLRQSGMLPRAADACRALHAGPRFANDFDMFARQARYLRIVLERGFWLPPGYAEFDDKFQKIKAALAVQAGPTVPCNNDLLAGNFVDDGSKLWIIDYEYSGNNDPYFELGNTWTECRLDLEHLDEYVTAYAGRYSPVLIARTRLQSIVSQYGWSLWGYIQAATNDFDFDFQNWGMERFDGAAKEFGSADFDRLLEHAVQDEKEFRR